MQASHLRSLIHVLRVLLLLGTIATGVLALRMDLLVLHPKKLEPNHAFTGSGTVEECWMEQPDGARIHGLWFKVPESKGLVLYFHGNAGNLDRWQQYAPDFTQLGYEVMMIDYRGFGKSTGPCNEAAFHADALAAYRYMRKHYAADEITLYGRSLGSGVATQLAAAVPSRRLILETPFFNLPDVVRSYAPFLQGAIPDTWAFRSDLFIQQVSVPIYMFHGTADGVVPYREGHRFQQLLGDRVEFITIPGGGHKNLAEFPAYHKALQNIIRH